MTPGSSAGPEHPTSTRRNGYRYFFHPKHHGAGRFDDARWSAEMTRDEEFQVFDDADFHEVVAENSYLYGVLRGADNKLRDLGTWEQQVAEFRRANEGVPWHGYPLCPVSGEIPESARRRIIKPSKVVFQRMTIVGMITIRERRRLMGGKHV